MISRRALTAADLERTKIFASEYRSRTYLEVEESGSEPELQWTLREALAPHELRRRLEGQSVAGLAELYGPREQLKFIGAFEEEDLVGLVTWRWERWNSMVWLCDIRVRDDRRRQGIARRMFEDLQWQAMRLNARGIMLETQNTNHPAVQFYLNLGFQLTGLNTSLYGPIGSELADIALFFYFRLSD